MNGFYIDLESDNLYLQSTKIWYMKLTSLDGSRSMQIWPFRENPDDVAQKLDKWVASFTDGCFVVGHGILGYDTWMLWKFYGIQPKVGKKGKDWLGDKHVQFIDTLVLSQYLQPDVGGHSLEYLSEGNEEEKLKYREKLVEAGAMAGNEPKGYEFSFYHDLMVEYCDQDVAAGIGVFHDLWGKAEEMYKNNWIHKSYNQVQKDFFLYAAQSFTGVKFDQQKAIALAESIEKMMEEIKAEVDPILPPRKLKKAEEAFYKIPAKPFTKNGEHSANMLKWLEKHKATVEERTIYAYGRTFNLIANEVLDIKLPMEIDDNAELKDYFLESGWVPHDDFWNFKRDERGKPARDDRGQIIKTTPKIQHAGQICPNLLKLEADTPKKVVKYLSLRNRLSVIRGWLGNERLKYDGRLSANITGYTPTFRVKHSTVVNVPKADPKVLLGNEMRELFTVEEGNFYIGTDAAALENRTLASYTMKYDGGEFADRLLKGDSHSFNAFAFFPEIKTKFDINDPTLKDQTEFKPYRNKSKTG